MTNKDWQAVDWDAHAMIDDGSGRFVWVYSDDDNKNVFQITDGGPPETSGGYHRLESLLSLKGIPISDLRVADAPSP